MRSNMGGQPWWGIMIVLSLCLLLAQQASADGLAISYCSTDNNSGNYQGVYAEFQSTGLCGDHCQGSYVFAVIQGYYCWCSNYVPAVQNDTYLCNQGCPGINTEWCGNTDAGLYAYFQLSGGQPLGTAGSGSSSASATSSNPSSTQPTTFSSSTYVPPSSSSSDPETTSSPTEVYTSVTTVTGQVRTVIVTPSATADATLGQSATSGGSGVSAGKVAGIVIGVAVGLGLIVGGGVWWWLRRRNRGDERGSSPDGSSFSPQRTDGSSGTIPSRQVSQMSQAGLLGKKPRIMTTGLAPGNDLRSADTMSSNIDRRSLGTDQRLNPYALYIHDEAQLSSVSLQDNQDYSRQLRIANPDP